MHDAAAGQFLDGFGGLLRSLARVNGEVSAERFGQRHFFFVQVDSDDRFRPCESGPHDGGQADTAKPEHRDRLSGLCFRRVGNGADTGNDRASEQRRIFKCYIFG